MGETCPNPRSKVYTKNAVVFYWLKIYHKLSGLKHCICYLRMSMGQEPLYSLAGSFCFSRGKTQILKAITALCHLVPTGSNMVVYVFKTDYRRSLLKGTTSTGVTTIHSVWLARSKSQIPSTLKRKKITQGMWPRGHLRVCLPYTSTVHFIIVYVCVHVHMDRCIRSIITLVCIPLDSDVEIRVHTELGDDPRKYAGDWGTEIGKKDS